MKNKKIKIRYCLIPMLIAVCICVWLSVGKTKARCNVVAGNTVFLQEQQLSIHSNLLMPQGQTVLLNPMETDGERKLTLETLVTGGNCTARLEFQYLDKGVSTMESIPSANFQLADGTLHSFIFQLKPAVQYLEEDQKISLQINLEIYEGQDITGELLQSMSAVVQTTVKANPAPIPTETTEPTEVTEPVAAASESGTDVIDEQMVTEIIPGMLSGMTEIVGNGLLGLSVTAPDADTAVQIAMLQDTQLADFPARIRYRMQGSQVYTMLYDGGMVTIPAGTAEQQLLVLDFSQLETPLEETTFHLVADTDTGYISNYLTVSTALQMPDVLSNEAPLMVSETVPLKVEIPAFWQGTTLVYEIQRLYDETEQMPAGTLEDGMLTVDSNKGPAAPGTYQLALRWYYGQNEQSEGILIAEETAVFCVNYTAFVQPEREQIQFPTTEPMLALGEEDTQ